MIYYTAVYIHLIPLQKTNVVNFSALPPELQRTKEDGEMNWQPEFESCFR